MELQEGSREALYQIMVARYYSSSLGRFMAVDPHGGVFGNPQSLNRYAYALNNPLRFTDPRGLAANGGMIGGSGCQGNALCLAGLGGPDAMIPNHGRGHGAYSPTQPTFGVD